MDVKAVRMSLDRIKEIRTTRPPTEERLKLILKQIARGIDALIREPEPEKPIIDAKKVEADRLFNRFTLANDFLMHLNWEVFNLGAQGVVEPPAGCGECYSSGAIDAYLSRNKVNTIKPRRFDSSKALDGLYQPEKFGIKPVRLSGFKDGDIF